MPSFLEWGSGGDLSAPLIKDLPIGRDPRLVVLFTSDFEQVPLHFVGDPAVHKYAVCPGAGCPLCALGGAPGEFALLPVFDIESSAVGVLRISSTRGPTSLRGVLARHLADPAIAEKVVVLRRENNSTFHADARPLASGASRGENEIRGFLDERERGLQLRETIWQPTAAELREIPTIRVKLEAIGGLSSALGDTCPF